MLYIAADHRGYKLKEELKKYLADLGYEFEDLGNDKYEPEDDYPDFAALVGEKVSADPENNKGIVICGSGVGMMLAVNKFKGVRSGLAINKDQARDFTVHDAINILSLSADYTSVEEVKEIVKVWLETPASQQEKYKRRIEKNKKIEK